VAQAADRARGFQQDDNRKGPGEFARAFSLYRQLLFESGAKALRRDAKPRLGRFVRDRLRENFTCSDFFFGSPREILLIVHAQIGSNAEGFHFGGIIWIKCHTNTGSYTYYPTFHGEWLVEVLQERLGDLMGTFSIDRVLENY
jgi:hypothetical protein